MNLPKEHFPLIFKRMYNACLDTLPENLKHGLRTCGLQSLNRNTILRKLPKVTSNAQADKSMNEILLSLVEEHHSQ